VTRRDSSPLVTSNTIFDVTRRDKTLLVMPNIHCVQRGNDATHRSNNTSPPSPPSLEMRDRGGLYFILFPPTCPLSPPSLEMQDGDDTTRPTWQLPMTRPTAATTQVPHPLPRLKCETEGFVFHFISSNLSPSSLETQDGDDTTHCCAGNNTSLPSLARNVRRRGDMSFYLPPPLSPSKTSIRARFQGLPTTSTTPPPLKMSIRAHSRGCLII